MRTRGNGLVPPREALCTVQLTESSGGGGGGEVGGRGSVRFSPLSTNSCPVSRLSSHRRGVSPDARDQPPAILSVVHGLYVHHSGLNSRLILWKEKSDLWTEESLWPWGHGFNDPSRRNHKDTLGSEFCHSDKETMMVRAQGRVSGAGRVDKGLPSLQTPSTCSSCSQTLRNLDSKCDGP